MLKGCVELVLRLKGLGIETNQQLGESLVSLSLSSLRPSFQAMVIPCSALAIEPNDILYPCGLWWWSGAYFFTVCMFRLSDKISVNDHGLTLWMVRLLRTRLGKLS